jgi:Serine dehydrogenase proteinase
VTSSAKGWYAERAMADSPFDALLTAAGLFMEETGRDLLVFSGAIDDDNGDSFIEQVVSHSQRRSRVALFLCTYGGDPHAAYRMARTLRRCYPEEIRILVPSYCKSAGTLIALCADSLGFSVYGELGPLDTQLSRPDEIMQRASGLEVFSTLQYLTDHAFSCFEQNMLTILRKSGQTISTRLASEIASKLATGLVKPISAQLDPHRIGLAQRGLEVTKAYGKLLANEKNLKFAPETVVNHLVNDYPTHAFVIDREEASTLFSKVGEFSAQENSIFERMKSALMRPQEENPLISNLAALVVKRASKTEQENTNGKAKHTNRKTSPSGERQPNKPTTKRPNGRSAPSDHSGEPEPSSGQTSVA